MSRIVLSACGIVILAMGCLIGETLQPLSSVLRTSNENEREPLTASTEKAELSTAEAEKSTAAVPVGAAQHGSLIIEKVTHDFGKSLRGSTVPAVFQLENRGSSPLTITAVKAACGCTATQLKDKVIPPGESRPLDVKLNLSLQKGLQNKEIAVNSDDPEHPVVVLRLIGESVSLVDVSPERAVIGPVNDDQGSKTLAVTALDDLNFTILNTRVSDEWVSVEVKPVEEGKKYEAVITVKAKPDRSYYRGWVHLKTDQKGEYNTIGIAVEAKFTPLQADTKSD